MGKKTFTRKELDEIRDIAIRLYVNDGTFGTTQDTLRFQVIAEATFTYLKGKGLIKDEHLASKSSPEG